jgi:four helix bundle protein
MAEGTEIDQEGVRGNRKWAFCERLWIARSSQTFVVSIMPNIAEGFERARQSEFHQFLSIAKSSCAELRSHLYVAQDAKYVDTSMFNELMSLAQEVSLVLGGLRSAVQRRRAERESHGR